MGLCTSYSGTHIHAHSVLELSDNRVHSILELSGINAQAILELSAIHL